MTDDREPDFQGSPEKTVFKSLPDWEFEVVESTAGGYTVRGTGPQRLEVSFQGNDPERLLERAKAAALEVSAAAAMHLKSKSSGGGKRT